MNRTVGTVLIVVWLLALGFLAALAEGLLPKTLRQLLLVVLVVGPVLIFGEALLQLVCYGVAWVIVPLVTFGWLRVEGFRTTTSLSFPWYGVARTDEGKFVVSGEAGSMIGLGIVVATIAAAAFIYAQ